MIHMHWYRVESPWTPYDWGGLHCYRQTKRCRCGATRLRVKGSL